MEGTAQPTLQRNRPDPNAHRTTGAIEAKAEARLRQAAYPALRQVSCDVRNGVLTLRGRVPTYYLKQIAQTLVLSVEGVVDVNNELDVGPIPSRLQWE